MPPLAPTVFDLIGVEKSQLGYKEARGNRTKYGKAYGMDGNAWCGMFQWWCFREVGIDLKKWTSNPAYTPTFYQGLVDDPQDWIEVPERDARPGDIAFMGFPGGRAGIEHVGMVWANIANGRSFTTLDGNTGSGSQTNGDGVYLRNRAPSMVLHVVRYKHWRTGGTNPLPQPAPQPQHMSDAVAKELRELLFYCKQTVLGPWPWQNNPIAVRVLHNGLLNAGLGIKLPDAETNNSEHGAVFGQQTLNAVKWFQGKRGLIVDGWVRDTTWHALYPA